MLWNFFKSWGTISFTRKLPLKCRTSATPVMHLSPRIQATFEPTTRNNVISYIIDYYEDLKSAEMQIEVLMTMSVFFLSPKFFRPCFNTRQKWLLNIKYILPFTPRGRVLLEKLTGSAALEPEGSSPYSQVPATCPYPQPTPSSPHNHLPLPEDPS